MDKKYVIRQLTLYKLGIPMDKDIQEYYDYFHQLISDIYKFDVPILSRDYPFSIFWAKEDWPFLEYIKTENRFLVSKKKLWDNFDIKYNMDYNTIDKLFSGLLEDHFKVCVESTHCAW